MHASQRLLLTIERFHGVFFHIQGSFKAIYKEPEQVSPSDEDLSFLVSSFLQH